MGPVLAGAQGRAAEFFNFTAFYPEQATDLIFDLSGFDFTYL